MTKKFLRSISLKDDLDKPQRLAVYRPTRKSMPVLEAVITPGSCALVIAAYGSGKSLSAAIGALAVRNAPDAQPVLKVLHPALARVDAAVAKRVKERSKAPAGSVVVLTGYVPDPVAAIAKQLELLDLDLDGLGAAYAASGRKGQIAIVWDEFGRHLETLVDNGRATDLDIVQRIAEWAARAPGAGASLTLLMHQGLLAYAGRLNQAARNEWRKIEGRFRTIRFVEDSREIYELLAAAILERRGVLHEPLIASAALDVLASARWLDGMPAGELGALAEKAWPVSLAALQVLPALVARVGQNERSLFSFLDDISLAAPVGLMEVFKAFSDALRMDVGIGGAYRRWLETQSALSRTDSDIEREVIVSAALLQLGQDGERARLRRSVLEAAVATRGYDRDEVRASIDALLERKLLLWRRQNDDISVWHGADVDLARKVSEVRDRRRDGFDLVAFLKDRLPAPFVRPVRHNNEKRVLRYLSGVIIPASAIMHQELPEAVLPRDEEDGKVVYLIPESSEEVQQARDYASREGYGNRTMVVVPDEPLDLVESALELVAIEELRDDEVLLASDPLVGKELDELHAVAQAHLFAQLSRVLDPRPSGAAWYARGVRLDVDQDRPASVAASRLMDEAFGKTPIIANDQVMRNRISRQIRTARVRVVRNILEQCGRPDLGYVKEDTSSMASLYRTVLAQSGLYRTEGARGRFADPEEITEGGLRVAWEHIRAFFTTQSEAPKPLSSLTSSLAAVPFGIPDGVIPILVMAGYRKFARNVALRIETAYMPDVLGFDVERMFADPAKYTVEVGASDEATLDYLRELAFTFHHRRPEGEVELLRFAHDALAAWKAALPESAKRTNRLSPGAKKLVREVFSCQDPFELFMRRLPRLAAGSGSAVSVISAIEALRNEIDSLVEGYTRDAVDAVSDTFSIGMRGGDPLAKVADWVNCFGGDIKGLNYLDKRIIQIARETASGRYSPESFARTLSSILLQRGIENWEDTTVGHFRLLLRETRSRIENAALDSAVPDPRIRPLLEARIDVLQRMLDSLGVPDGAAVTRMRVGA